jgi:protein tyrosine phosphatase (PTP) superfamily phosphohydrolase (DUF442 family)
VNCLELDKDFAVGTSPSLLELQQLKSCGFNAVVDLRMPDEVGALTITDEREAARSSGMTFLHIAVPARTVPSELLSLFRQAAEAGLRSLQQRGPSGTVHRDSSWARGRSHGRRNRVPYSRGRILR